MKKFKEKSKATAQLGQAFKRHEQAIIQVTTELLKSLYDISAKNGMTIVLQADKLADAHHAYIQALYASTLIADATARPSVDDILRKENKHD